MEKKVLIITYYWPPSGGSGVQRWLKFVKYLPQFGWTPYVYTPENPSFEIRDESLLNDIPMEAEIIKMPIWEPYDAFKKLSRVFTGKVSSSKPTDIGSGNESLFQKISTWIRGNLILPDPKIFWVRPSVKFLSDFVVDKKIRTIITTGPPHSIHLIGKKLKKKNPSLHWIADFRDPWSEWGFLDSIKSGRIAKAVHRRLEAKVLRQADEVITITPFYVNQFKKLSGRRVQLLTNGFDESDFINFSIKKVDTFYIRHIGTVNEKCDPRPFMKACSQVCEESPELKEKIIIEFVGEVHSSFKEFVNADSLLSSITRFTKSVSHKELMDIYSTTAVLVLILTGYKDAEGYMPGKLFEYLATGLPILGVGPTEGDAANLLQQSQSGHMFNSGDSPGITSFIQNSINGYKGEGKQSTNSNQMNYSRKAVTKELVELLK